MKLFSLTILVIFLSITVASGSILSRVANWFKELQKFNDIEAELKCHHDAITSVLIGTDHLQEWEKYDIRIDPERETLACIPEMGLDGGPDL